MEAHTDGSNPSRSASNYDIEIILYFELCGPKINPVSGGLASHRRRRICPSVTSMQVVREQRSPRTWLAVLHHLAGLVVGAVSFPIVLAGITAGAALAPSEVGRR